MNQFASLSNEDLIKAIDLFVLAQPYSNVADQFGTIRTALLSGFRSTFLINFEETTDGYLTILYREALTRFKALPLDTVPEETGVSRYVWHRFRDKNVYTDRVMITRVGDTSMALASHARDLGLLIESRGKSSERWVFSGSFTRRKPIDTGVTRSVEDWKLFGIDIENLNG